MLTLSALCNILPTLGVAMTDGPFRNTELSSSWKRYGQDLVSDAASLDERVKQACHSMLGDVDMKVFSALLKSLGVYAQRSQMDLDPISQIETIFNGYSKSPLTDTFQKHFTANLRDGMLSETALNQALGSIAKEWISTTKNRLDEECIRAREVGDMSREDYSKGIERNGETFAAVDPKTLCDALTSGNKRAFKQIIEKKVGIDEGPDE
jgi:hypothetical protein